MSVSHRKRRAARPVAVPEPTPGQRAASLIGLFIRENVRTMLLFVGIMTLMQAMIPWTNSATDRIPFIVVGSIFLGLSIPRRFWQ